MSKRYISDFVNKSSKCSKNKALSLSEITEDVLPKLNVNNAHSLFDIKLYVSKKMTDAEKIQHLSNL